MTRAPTFKQPVKKKQKITHVSAPKGTTVIQKYPTIKYVGDTQRDLYSSLSKRQVLPNKYINIRGLSLITCVEEFERKLRKIGWSDLVYTDEPSYVSLTYEFLSSITVRSDSTLSFRIANVQHEVTKATLASMFAWELIEQQKHPENYVTPFWMKITRLLSTEKYVPRLANSSEIVNPGYRYFARLMSYTIYGRTKSNGRLQMGELELLYYFDAGIQVDWTSLLINRFLYQAKRTTCDLVIGGFITRIVEELGVFDRKTTSLKRADGWASELNEEYLIGMHMLRRHRLRLLLVPHKRDAHNSDDVSREDIEPKLTIEEQVANLQKGQDALQSSHAQLLQNQKSLGKQLAEMFAFMQQRFQHHTP